MKAVSQYQSIVSVVLVLVPKWILPNEGPILFVVVTTD